MGNHHVRFRGRGRGQSRWEPSPLPDGAEGFEEISIRHSKFASHRFAHQAAPALERFATSSPAPFMAGIKAARETIVARKDDDREAFLRKRGFSATRPPGSSPRCWRRKADRPSRSSISCRGSRRLLATSRTKTAGWNWRARPPSSSPASGDIRKGVNPVPRLYAFAVLRSLRPFRGRGLRLFS